MGHDVAFEIDAWRNFDQFERAVDGAEDRALGHEHGRPALLLGEARVVANLLDRGHELAGPTFGKNTQTAAGTFELEPRGREGAAEHDFAGVLTDVKEAADADDLAAEAADIDVAPRIDFSEGQKGNVQPAAIVEIELVGLIDDGVVVLGRAGIDARERRAADEALLVRQHDLVENFF